MTQTRATCLFDGTLDRLHDLLSWARQVRCELFHRRHHVYFDRFLSCWSCGRHRRLFGWW